MALLPHIEISVEGRSGYSHQGSSVLAHRQFPAVNGRVAVSQEIVQFGEFGTVGGRVYIVFGADGIRRCAIVIEPQLVQVAATPKRAFQGWRYLPTSDSPPDLTRPRPNDDELPPELQAELANIGIL